MHFLLNCFRVFCGILASLMLLAMQGAVAAQEKSRADQGSSAVATTEREAPFQVREFRPAVGTYRARGICYGPYRAGQRPSGTEPNKSQIEEDLRLLSDDGWQMIRTYGAEPFARKVCDAIQDNRLPLKVMLGVWVATEEGRPERVLENSAQLSEAIDLANKYPDVVAAVSVGNESQVFWSFHKVAPATLIRYIRTTRAKIKQPVTVADDFEYWTREESKEVASEIDFIVTHIYAMWHGRSLDEALEFTKSKYAAVCQSHPDRLVVIGEAGWATEKPTTGDQANRLRGTAGESEQKLFFREYTQWLHGAKIPYFYFEAFDEPWKGSTDPADAEKHWGLFRENRTRKPAIEKGSKSR